MVRCEHCGKNVDSMPWKCKRCGKTFCGDHRLPEDHDCSYLKTHPKKLGKGFNGVPKKSKIKRKIQSHENSYPHLTAEDLFREPTPRKRKRRIRWKPKNITTLLFWIVILLILSSLISSFYLMATAPINQDMQFSVGNPKPIYFYDIDSSCDPYKDSITSSLDELSEKAGIKFVSLPSPLALILGGISYNCEGVVSSQGYFGEVVGESESGYIGGVVGVPFLIIWNKIMLLDTSEEVVIHETLHSMGFDHNSESDSIMYAYVNGASTDDEISSFLRTKYFLNPLSYLNIIPFNLLLVLAIVFFFGRK